jgi:hypothetical protein
MNKNSLVVFCVFALALVSCGPVEFRVDEKQGIPSIKGSNEVSLPTNFVCGTPISTGTSTVQSKRVSGGCELTYEDTIEVVKAADYNSIPELKGAGNLVQRIEIVMKTLSFVDGTTMATLDLQTRITSAELSLNGQQVADKSALANLPITVKLEGAALNAIKAKVDARQSASVATKVVVVVPDMPKPPEKLRVTYDAQPALIVGPGKLF